MEEQVKNTPLSNKFPSQLHHVISALLSDEAFNNKSFALALKKFFKPCLDRLKQSGLLFDSSLILPIQSSCIEAMDLINCSRLDKTDYSLAQSYIQEIRLLCSAANPENKPSLCNIKRSRAILSLPDISKNSLGFFCKPPDIWNDERLIDHYVHREDIYRDLCRLFSAQNSTEASTIVTLQGPSGIGKTVMARYFFQHSADYMGKYFFNASHRGLLIEELRDFAKDKKISSPSAVKSNEEILQLIKEWFQRQDRWLVVFDGLEDENLLLRCLPASSGHVLITTQRLMAFNIVPVRSMNPEDAICLIGKMLRYRADASSVRNLANKLDDMPYAISLACAYINLTRITIDEYLTLISCKRGDILNKQRLSLERLQISVAIAFQITCEQLTKQMPDMMTLLNIFTYLVPKNLARNFLPFLLTKISADYFEVEINNNEMGALGSITQAPEISLDQCIKRLADYALIALNIEGDCISVHQIIQFFVYCEQQRANTAEEWFLHVESQLREGADAFFVLGGMSDNVASAQAKPSVLKK